MPKRSNVDDFFAQLTDDQRPHLESLREMSRAVAPGAREELKWNLPVYVCGENTNIWTIQNFTKHCSLRFSTTFFAAHRAAVAAAGYEAGAGFVKLPYARELPVDFLQSLMRARLQDYQENAAD